MIKCPVCDLYEFENDNDFDSCDVCHWQNDGVQLDDPDFWGGANDLSLNDYRREWHIQNAVQSDRREAQAV